MQIHDRIVALALLAGAALAQAQGSRVELPTREGVTTALYWEPVAGATATVLLLPGGGGGFGPVKGGRPSSPNFLVRSAAHFAAQGFNVAILGRPSDMAELGFEERTGENHLADVRRVIEHLKRERDVPVWLVGTSRGTVSATAAAIRAQAPIAGLVLSASVVRHDRPGALPRQDLAAIQVPVLLLHHRDDACPICRPHEVPAVLRGLVNAPARKLVMLDGGGPPAGDPCGPLHWHGFVGIERAAVDLIAAWIRRPTN